MRRLRASALYLTTISSKSMSFFSQMKKHIRASSISVTPNGLASSQVSPSPSQRRFPTNLESESESESESHLQSPQEKQQSQTVGPWSAHAPSSGKSPSPFLRHAHALSASVTASGELFLFGGCVHKPRSPNNDLYVISTRDFSTTLLQTSGEVPSPRFAHRAVLTSTTLLIWGGSTDLSDQNAPNQSDDDAFYLLNLVLREWSRIVVNGLGPCGRYYHTMTLVGSKVFVFGGRTAKRSFNDIWALDLNCLESNPFWESYKPAPGDEKPPPRAGHVSVTTGDRIIIFGGCAGSRVFNDTWSFNISTRKWTELQCTGSIPSPRAGHAAVLIDDVMYVYGGRTVGRTNLDDLTTFNLSTLRWTAFQDIGPGPGGRGAHAMASDGRRVFVLGGELSPGAQVQDAKFIHVLDTKHLDCPKPESDAVDPSEKITELVRKSLEGSPARRQTNQSSSSSESSDAHAAHDASPFATPEELDHSTFQQITRKRNPSLNSLPSQRTSVDDKRRQVPQKDDNSEGSAEHLTKLVAPDTSSRKEVLRLEHERIVDLERQLSETLAERDRHIAQLTDQLAQNSALLKQTKANAAEAKKRAGLDQRELRAKLDELLLSRDQAEENAAEEKKRAGLKQRELQDKLDKLLLSRDQALEQAQSALQKATFRAAEANERSQRELAELRAKLEARESELAAVRLQLTDAEDGWAKSRAEAGTSRTGTRAAAGPVNMDMDRVMWRLMERVRSVEAEMASLRGNEKGIEEMECRNEG